MIRRRFILPAFVFFLLSIFPISRAAAENTFSLPEGWGEIGWEGENRSRYYGVDYFSADQDNDYAFGSNQLKIGADWDHPLFDLAAAVQYTQLIGLPESTSSGAGAGSLYFANTRTDDPGSVYLKYLHLDTKEIGDTGLTFSGGRFDFESGNGYRTGTGKGLEAGDPHARESKQVRWLKSQRIGERLIGGFGWSEFQRSFDGVAASWDTEPLHVRTAVFHPTQGGFEERAGSTMNGIDVVATELTLKKDVWGRGTEFQLLHYYYGDSRALLSTTGRPDNTGRAVLAGEESDIGIHTIGGHAATAFRLAEGVLADGFVWGVHQSGSWFEEDVDAWAVAVEGGVQFDGCPWEPWIRGGWNAGSGDSDPRDGDHETFFQMVPTARLYSWSILYNLMNTEDAFVMLLLRPVKPLNIRMDVHFVRLAESADRWYLGSGAGESSRDIGFAVRPSNGSRDLGTLWDAQATWQFEELFSLTGYFGHFFGGDVVESLFPEQSDSNFGFLELDAKF